MREASDRLGGKNDLTDKYTKSHFCNHKSCFFSQSHGFPSSLVCCLFEVAAGDPACKMG